MKALLKTVLSVIAILLGTEFKVLCSPNPGASPAAIPGQNKGPVPPAIRRHPSSQIATRTDTVVFECQAEGYPDPRIYWLKDGKPLSSKSNGHQMPTGDLMFYSSSRSEDQGTYQCVATNSLGSVKSQNATFQIAYIKEEFRKRPYDMPVAVGDTATLECQSPRGLPSPKIYWKKNSRKIVPNGRIRLEKGNLIISSTTRSDTGSYSCVAQNIAGSRESLKAILSVHVPPGFTVLPKDETVLTGDDVELTCQASGDPAPRINWDKVQGSFSSRVVLLSNHNLQILNVQPEDAGEYECSAQNVAKTVRATATIIVNEKPHFTTPPYDVTTRVGDTVNIPCVADGKPKPSIIWNKKDGPLMLSGQRYENDHISISANGELTIYNAKFSDQGKYICKAYSLDGSSVRAEAQVNVLSRENKINPPVITRGPSNMTIEQGSNIEFKCSSLTVPAPEFTWFKDNSDMKTGGRFTVSNGGLLTIAAIQNGDAGRYRCTATNDYGWSHWDFWIKVASRGSPSLTSKVNPRDLPSAPSSPDFVNSTSSSITLRWSASSSSVSGYILEYYCLQGNISTWTPASPTLIRTTIHIVRNLKESSNCVFFVRAQNSHGTSDPSEVSATFETKASSKPDSADDKLLEKLSQISVRVTSVQASSSSDSTAIFWEPSNICNVIDGYRIFAQAVSVKGQNPIVETVRCFANSKELNLKPKVYYEIRVRPFKGDVEGKFSPIVLAYPPSGDIKLEDLILNAHAESLKDNDDSATVKFSWNPPSNILPQYITRYTIRCYDKRNGKDAYDVTKRMNSSQTTLTLKGLPSDRSYSAYVEFDTAFGKGVQSEVVDFDTSVGSEQRGGVDGILKNPAILAGIAACVLLIIGIVVGVLLYRRHKKSKKGRGLHARSIQRDPASARYMKGFTMSIANSGGNNNYGDGAGNNPSGKMFMHNMSTPSPMSRNTTVSLNNSNGNVGTSISPNMGGMRSAQGQPGSFSYVTDQLTNMSNIHPQFSSPNVERNPTQTSLSELQQYHRRISEPATMLADEFVSPGDLIDMTTPNGDERYMTRGTDLPPPPPSPPMSQKTSFSDRTNRSHGSSRVSGDHGSSHSSKGRRSRERNRGYQPHDRVPTDTDTGIDSPQQTPSPPRPADLRGDHHPSSLPLKTRAPHYSYAPQSTSRLRNEGIPVEYSRSVGPNHGYYVHGAESEFDGNHRTNYIPLPDDVRHSVTASSVSMMNRYDSESNCSERSPSPVSSDDSLNMESVSQVGVNPNAITPASSAFVPVPRPYPHGNSISKQRSPYQKPNPPKKQYTSSQYENIHEQQTKPPLQEQFLNRVNSASSSSSSSFHQNTADSGMSAGVGSYGHNSLNSNSSSESTSKNQTKRNITNGIAENKTSNVPNHAHVDRRYVSSNEDDFHDSRNRPVLPPKRLPKMGMGGKSPQRIKSRDSSPPLTSNDGSAYIAYDPEANEDTDQMLPAEEYCTNEDDLNTDENRTAFVAAKSVFSGVPQKHIRGRFPELSDVPEVSTSDFCEDYSDRSQ